MPRNNGKVPAVASPTSAWVATLRQAMYDAVSEQDMKDIAAGLVKRAKEGDKAALTMLFEYVLGGRNPQQVSLVQNNYGTKPNGPPMDRARTAEELEAEFRRENGGRRQ